MLTTTKFREHHVVSAFSLRCNPATESEIRSMSSAWARIAILIPDRILSFMSSSRKTDQRSAMSNFNSPVRRNSRDVDFGGTDETFQDNFLANRIHM
jgi:hypothetical protein